MYYDSVIFDLDGTLLDTLGDLHSSVNYALRENGMPERTIDEVRRFVGNGIFNLIKRAVPDDCADKVTERVFAAFKAHYAEHSNDKTAAYPGVEDLVLCLREQGVRLGVVSNKAQFAVEGIMDCYFPRMFDVTFGEREGVPRKPEPDGVIEAAELLGSGKVLYVGDSEVDVVTARNAKVDAAFVTWGFRSKEELLAAGADVFASDTTELYRIIEEGAYAHSAN